MFLDDIEMIYTIFESGEYLLTTFLNKQEFKNKNLQLSQHIAKEHTSS